MEPAMTPRELAIKLQITPRHCRRLLRDGVIKAGKRLHDSGHWRLDSAACRKLVRRVGVS